MGLLDAISNLFGKKNTPAGTGNTASSKKTASPKTGPRTQEQGNPSDDPMSVSLGEKAKGRRKATQVKADPIDETALGFSISLKDGDQTAKKRNSIRVSVKGLRIYIIPLKKLFPVTDISSSGLGFKFEKPRMKGGAKLKAHLAIDREKVASNLVCKVMHHEKGIVGCRFEELDRAQDDAICKLVLQGQKEQAARKRAQKDKDFKVPS